MQTRITAQFLDNQQTTLPFSPEGISILKSSDPWVLSSIWRVAQERVLEQEGKRKDSDAWASAAHPNVEIETERWMVLIDPLHRGGTMGEFFGLDPLLVSLWGPIGGWSCPECGATVCRDSVADVSVKLSELEGGNVVCAIPREEGAPPLEELAKYFEATRIVRNERVFLLEDYTESRGDSIAQEWVVVSSRGLPLLVGDAESWLREQARLHPCRIDVGIVRRGDSSIQWVGIIGSSARCQQCGAASSPPSFRETRRSIKQRKDSIGLTLLNRPLGEILAGTLRESAQFIDQLLTTAQVGEVDTVFLQSVIAQTESVLDLPLTISLEQLPPDIFIRLALCRLRCAQVTGVQLFINQLDESEVVKLSECDTFASMANSIGGVVCLSRSQLYSPLTICSVDAGATNATTLRAEVSSIGYHDALSTIGVLDILNPGDLIRLSVDQAALLDPDLLEATVAAVPRSSGDRVSLVRCSGAEILQEEGEVGHLTGLYGLIAEVAARVPEARILGLSAREIESAIRGNGDAPLLFGFPLSALRSIPLEQLIYRIPRVGYASRGIEWIIGAGGGAISLSEQVNGHSPGLRVLYRLIRNLPLRGRCVLIHDVGWLLSEKEEAIVKLILTEELAQERRRSGGRVVWVDRKR
jgi:hypothetical protein